jgi:CRISPR-associated endonuclease/helicase Cas3
MSRYFAHTKEEKPPDEWQTIEDHLLGVANLCEGFAAKFGSGSWGRLAGLWHDLGKYSEAFQDYLRTVSSPDPHVADSEVRTGCSTRIDHSTAGAKHAVEAVEILGHLPAYVIAGHHSGLLDGRGDGPCLEARLGKDVEPWRHGLASLPVQPIPEPPSFLKEAFSRRESKGDAFTIAFFVRMLFSCLVDADFLDTERFMDRQRAVSRPVWPSDVLQRMEETLRLYVKGFNLKDTSVNRQRSVVRKACLGAAENMPGLFSLTVPTGGGKTLSSLAFALRHAVRHRLERVIYVIPFTSIIEQNADVFRKAMGSVSADLGMDPVLEHHSNLDTGEETVISRLATENWDAPLIVTTSVQFYDSLFGNRTSRCRKLHNLAKSVIILDEVQTLPVDYLEPCLKALRELTRSYGASVVLCTATQPAIHSRKDFSIGLEGVREIVSDPLRLYQRLKRVEVMDIGTQADESLAERILGEERILCIVNTRSHARKLFDALGDAENHFHLSALMCPEHRSEVLRTIRQRLEKEQECRVISTQLIEAGVDIDFPVVYRSLAGLDSIAQAAGRCNRNGKLQGKGQTYIFRSEHTRSERFFKETTNSTAQVLDMYEDPLSLEAIEHYFKLYYWDQSSRWDAKKILDEFHLNQDRSFPFSFGFSRVATSFHLIEDTGQAVIIPRGAKGRTLCEQLRATRDFPGRELFHKLQRYTVQIPRRTWDKACAAGFIDLVHERFPVLVSPEMHYSEHTGLTLDGDFSTLLNV